jgi:molybdopterin molybdotransferase
MPLDDALQALLAHAQTLLADTVSCFEADRRVLAQDIVAPLAVPGFDNSQMDGYALRSSDVREAGVVLQVTQRISAGADSQPLAPLSAARIFTGAPMPAGADAVVMQEDCEVVNECEGGVRIHAIPKPGQWVRRMGEDVAQGAILLSKGELLAPASIGLVASIGFSHVQVARRPRVALFSTGDELVMPGDVAPQDMKRGVIYNSNRFFLRAMLERLGCEVSDLGIVPDSREQTVAALKTAANHHDLILTSGGVSVGEEDHIKPAVQQLGSLDLWQVAIKPGKPFAYGRVHHVNAAADNAAPNFCHFIGLPGNPVSSFVTFLLLVRPFVRKLQGATDVAIKTIAAPADFTWVKPDKRREFLRVRRAENGSLQLFPNQGSGVLSSLAWADGLVDNPPGQRIAPGDVLRYIPLAELI